MFGHLTGRTVQDRLAGSLAAAERGAGIVRVHDVAANRGALAVLQGLTDQENR